MFNRPDMFQLEEDTSVPNPLLKTVFKFYLRCLRKGCVNTLSKPIHPIYYKNRMKTVYFLIQGQFGNNLFQYFAAEIMKKIYNYDKVEPTFYINLEFNTIIEDDKFTAIAKEYIKGNIVNIDTSKDILLMGFFQRSELFKFEREYVRSLFTLENQNHISNRITIANIIAYKSNHEYKPTKNDLTLHLRCGDFWDHERGCSQIFDPVDIKQLVQSIPHDKLYIVAQKPTQHWEEVYYSMYDDLKPIWITGNLGDDFDFLLRSTKLITSAATMSYMAAFLGDAEEVHIPYNYFYGGVNQAGQHLAEFDDTISKVHYNINTWLPPKGTHML